MQPFRFAILGAAKIGANFCDAARRVEGVTVAAVASKSMERARAFAEANGVEHYYADYAEMLDREKPDCAYVDVTPHDHFRLSMLCLEKGVPVLCEKAMFLNSADAERFFAVAREKKLFAMEALWSRFQPALNRAKEWLEAGRIGETVLAESALGFQPPMDAENRYFSPRLGGGPSYDVTVYSYETLTYLLGEAETTHAEVVPAFTGVDGTTIVTLRIGDVPAVLTNSFLTCLDNRLAIYGTRGRIVVPEPHCNREAFLYNEKGELEEHFVDTATENGFVYEIEEVVRRVRAGEMESPVEPHRATIACARLFDRILEKL